MVRNYFITALRHIFKHKTFSLINISGLALGLTAAFFIWHYVRFERSFDLFHENANRIYRVSAKLYQHDTQIGAGASVAPAVAVAMKEDFPEVVACARLAPTSLFTSDLTSFVANSLELAYHKPDGTIRSFHEEGVYFADDALLTIFSFPLVSGASDALREPNSVVITEEIARKYFGDEPALGKELRLNSEMLLRVTGVLKNIPANSHLQFDILISFPTIKKKLRDLDSWWGWGVCYSYVLLGPDANVKNLDAKIPAFMNKYLGHEIGTEYHTRFFFQPISDIHLKEPLPGEQSNAGDRWTVYFLSVLGVFILVVAWINYINLTTARSLERAKEVGLRKVVGAQRKQLMIQFLFEAAIINILALVVTAIFVLIAWPSFEKLVERNIIDDSWFGAVGTDTLLVMLAVIVVGTAIGGLYPALVLSSFTPAKALKGMFSKSGTGLIIRKTMVSFQYVLAMLLVAATVTIYLQLGFMRSQNPGFSKEQMLVVRAPAVYDSLAGDKVAHFSNLVSAMSGVNNVTASTDVPGKTIVEYFPIGKVGAKEEESFATYISAVDEHFFDTYSIQMLEGRKFTDTERMTFRKQDDKETIKVLVNEEFVRQMREQAPKDALKRKMVFWWGPDLRNAEVIGIVADHHQVSFKEKVQPIMYMQPAWTAWRYFSVNMANGDFKRTIEGIGAAYAKSFPGSAFEYFFLDDFFDRQYHADMQFGNVVNVFTILAIVVTCLGLIGLAIFSVGQRVKEIGIRKTLGATPTLILSLFVKDFLRITVMAFVIASPLIYFGADWWLTNFSFHIPVGWPIFAAPVILLSTITILTISSITLPAAVANPVKTLRSE